MPFVTVRTVSRTGRLEKKAGIQGSGNSHKSITMGKRRREKSSGQPSASSSSSSPSSSSSSSSSTFDLVPLRKKLVETPWLLSREEYLQICPEIFGLDKHAATTRSDTPETKVRENLAKQHLTVFEHVDRKRPKIECDYAGISELPPGYGKVVSRPASDTKRILLPPANVLQANGGEPFYVIILVVKLSLTSNQ